MTEKLTAGQLEKMTKAEVMEALGIVEADGTIDENETPDFEVTISEVL